MHCFGHAKHLYGFPEIVARQLIRQDNLQRAVSTLKDVEWLSPEVLFIVHAVDSAVTTVTIVSYTLFSIFFCALDVHACTHLCSGVARVELVRGPVPGVARFY